MCLGASESRVIRKDLKKEKKRNENTPKDKMSAIQRRGVSLVLEESSEVHVTAEHLQG